MIGQRAVRILWLSFRTVFALIAGSTYFCLAIVVTRATIPPSTEYRPGDPGPVLNWLFGGFCAAVLLAPLLGVLTGSALFWIIAGRHRREAGRCKHCGFKQNATDVDFCRVCGR